MPETASVTLTEFTEILSSSAGVRIAPDLVGEDATFAELGMDSLAVLGVISAFERTRGIILPPDVHETESVSDFLSLVNETVRKAG
jgi:minimal PKS acyl carrier protein